MTSGNAFDDLVAAADGAMLVVTTVSGDGERAGCLVGFHSQCSIEPAQYALWISRANHTFRVARQSEQLAVHFLAEGDHDIAELFGSVTGDEVDKFTRCTWTRGVDGLPLLDRLPNRFVGDIVGTIDEGGDHVCFVVVPTGVGDCVPGFRPLRFDAVHDIDAGHPA